MESEPKRVFLSYPLNPKDLVWPGEPSIVIEQCTKIGENSLCNTFCSKLPNHCGTHYDAPYHFNANGPRITELPMEYFWFERPCVIDVPKKAKEGVTVEDLKPFEKDVQKADLLLIKTGFAKVRKDAPKVYQMEGPCLLPQTCMYMVNTFPELRCVGFDFLSIGSPCNDLSAAAHQTLLGVHTEKYITAIEDMDLLPLYENDRKIKRVIVAPLRVLQVDSSQVTVICEFEE